MPIRCRQSKRSRSLRSNARHSDGSRGPISAALVVFPHSYALTTFGVCAAAPLCGRIRPSHDNVLVQRTVQRECGNRAPACTIGYARSSRGRPWTCATRYSTSPLGHSRMRFEAAPFAPCGRGLVAVCSGRPFGACAQPRRNQMSRVSAHVTIWQEAPSHA